MKIHTLFAGLVLALCASQSGLPAPPLRALSPQDLFRLEDLGEAEPSPDGQLLAYVLIRSKATASVHMRDFMEGMDRADIWVAPAKSGRPARITDGAVDGSGFFLPAWSPNGERLAMLSTRGRNVSLWVWERSSRTIRQVSKSTLDISRPVWLASDVIVCASVPHGEQPWKFAIETLGPEKAMQVWPKAWRGQASTANVLLSGSAVESKTRPQGRLLKFNLSKRTEQPIQPGNFTSVAASPDGRFIATLKMIGLFKPEPDQLLPNRDPVKYALVVIDADGKPLPGTEWAIEDPVPGSIRWSLDGTLVLQKRRSSGELDWLAVNGSSRRDVSAALSTSPKNLVPGAASGSFVAVSDGKLLLLMTNGSPPAAFNTTLDAKIDSIEWPSGRNSQRQPSWIVTSAGETLYAIDLRTGAFNILRKPSVAAQFIGFAPETGTAIFSESNRQGTFLRTSRGDVSTSRTIFATNEFLQEIAEAQLKRIDYLGADAKHAATARRDCQRSLSRSTQWRIASD